MRFKAAQYQQKKKPQKCKVWACSFTGMHRPRPNGHNVHAQIMPKWPHCTCTDHAQTAKLYMHRPRSETHFLHWGATRRDMAPGFKFISLIMYSQCGKLKPEQSLPLSEMVAMHAADNNDSCFRIHSLEPINNILCGLNKFLHGYNGQKYQVKKFSLCAVPKCVYKQHTCGWQRKVASTSWGENKPSRHLLRISDSTALWRPGHWCSMNSSSKSRLWMQAARERHEYLISVLLLCLCSDLACFQNLPW